MPKVEVGFKPEEVVAELNEISKFLADRIPDGDEDRVRTLQLIALVALWMRRVQDNPERNRKLYAELAWAIASGMELDRPL